MFLKLNDFVKSKPRGQAAKVFLTLAMKYVLKYVHGGHVQPTTVMETVYAVPQEVPKASVVQQIILSVLKKDAVQLVIQGYVATIVALQRAFVVLLWTTAVKMKKLAAILRNAAMKMPLAVEMKVKKVASVVIKKQWPVAEMDIAV